MDELEPFFVDDAGPAYLELYSHAPVLAIRLGDAAELLSLLGERELVQWAHGVELFLEGALSSLGLYKAPGRALGCVHLFCINPELAALEQARVMEQGALKLLELLPQVRAGAGEAAAAAGVARPCSLAAVVVAAAAAGWGAVGWGADQRCSCPHRHPAPAPAPASPLPLLPRARGPLRRAAGSKPTRLACTPLRCAAAADAPRLLRHVGRRAPRRGLCRQRRRPCVVDVRVSAAWAGCMSLAGPLAVQALQRRAHWAGLGWALLQAAR
jgi:hypothetical protein